MFVWIFRIIIAIAYTALLWITTHHDGKTIHDKQLSKEEKKYLDLLECIAFIVPLFLAGIIMSIIEN